MKTLYFDCFSGIAGDMAVGALVDAGFPVGELAARLGSLRISGLSVKAEAVMRGGIAATAYVVDAPHEHAHRTFRDIRSLIATADLAAPAAALATEIFHGLALAEGALHRRPPDDVHFHEVGAADAIADIVGFACAYEGLGIVRARASRIPWTRGHVHTAHGVLPVPAPATLALLQGFVLEEVDLAMELVTPTGAAILAATAGSTTGAGRMRLEAVGYGAGAREIPGRLNVLRVAIGDGDPDCVEAATGAVLGEAILLEVNLDDMDARLVPVVVDALFAADALDVWVVPVQMKKGRPGLVISALGRPEALPAMSRAVLHDTTSIGLRYRPVERLEMARKIVTHQTSLGPVRFKIAGGRARPEFDDCRAIAERTGMPVGDVLAAVTAEGAALQA